MKRKVVNLALSLIGPIALIIILTMPIGPLTGGLGIIQPIGGIFDIAALFKNLKARAQKQNNNSGIDT